MRCGELLEIIRNGENSGVEFKRDDIRPEQLAKEIVALANLSGGLILLGVEDDGTITGIQRPRLEEWVMDAVFGTKVHPMIIPFYKEIKLEDGKRVAAISFPQGTSKPYVVRHNHREDIYIRAGSTSRLATREQQARLFASGGVLHPELLPVSGAAFNALDLVRLQNYLQDIINDPEIPDSDDAWVKRLVGLGFMADVADIGPVCTIAGLVLFGFSPRRHLKQAGVRAMAFDGADKTYQALLDEIIDSPLVGRWRKDEDGRRVLADPGVIERFSDMTRPFLIHEADAIDEAMRRTKTWLYPREAVRESLVNALAHRDWTRSVDVEVAAYADRLEIVSPGPLPNAMTIEKMIAGQRSPRNPLIVEVLRDYGYVEARGMGVRTKIIPLMRQHNRKEPFFENAEDYLRTVLPRGDELLPNFMANSTKL